MFLARINRECISLFCRKIDYACSQLVDLQIFAAPRITLKPLVPTFPCFASLVLSLMEKVSRNFVPFLGEWTYNNFFFFFFHYFCLLAATCRLWVEDTGRGHHVHTWPLSVCSGAALINFIGKLGCWNSVYMW